MNKKKIIIIISIIAALLILLLVGFLVINNFKKKDVDVNKTETKKVLEESEESSEVFTTCGEGTMVVDNCKEGVCDSKFENEYCMLKISFSRGTIEQMVNRINEKTFEYYDMSMRSRTEDEECPEDVRSHYRHSKVVFSTFTGEDTGRYYGIFVTRNIVNICNRNSDSLLEFYLYDRTLDKEITEDEFLNQQSMTREQVNDVISKKGNIDPQFVKDLIIYIKDKSIQASYTDTRDGSYKDIVIKDTIKEE